MRVLLQPADVREGVERARRILERDVIRGNRNRAPRSARGFIAAMVLSQFAALHGSDWRR